MSKIYKIIINKSIDELYKQAIYRGNVVNNSRKSTIALMNPGKYI